MLLQVAGDPVPQLKLLDFGVAKIREDQDGAVVDTIPDSDGGLATKVGALMGTVRIILVQRPDKM